MTGALGDHHLQVLGQFEGGAQDGLPTQGTLSLLGPGSGFWVHFQSSEEYHDGQAYPMDRWSKRVISTLAEGQGGQAFFPFGGPPYHPFYTWAVKTGRCFASPIGFLVHDRLGLMVSFRGAIFVPGAQTSATEPRAPSPCETCPTRPCSSACPVDAFANGYDTVGCHDYLDTERGQKDCMALGCAARRACPVGQDLRLPEHSAFHMAQFHKALF